MLGSTNVTLPDKRIRPPNNTIVILEEDDEWRATVEPGETLRNLCTFRCSIAIGTDEESDLEGTEAVIIVDSRLFVFRHSG